MTTFITRYETSGSGVRLAVKDLIDMEGEPTTAGWREMPCAIGRIDIPPSQTIVSYNCLNCNAPHA